MVVNRSFLGKAIQKRCFLAPVLFVSLSIFADANAGDDCGGLEDPATYWDRRRLEERDSQRLEEARLKTKKQREKKKTVLEAQKAQKPGHRRTLLRSITIPELAIPECAEFVGPFVAGLCDAPQQGTENGKEQRRHKDPVKNSAGLVGTPQDPVTCHKGDIKQLEPRPATKEASGISVPSTPAAGGEERSHSESTARSDVGPKRARSEGAKGSHSESPGCFAAMDEEVRRCLRNSFRPTLRRASTSERSPQQQ